MATFEEKLQADRDWLKDQLETFELHLSKDLKLDGAQIGQKRFDLRDMAMGIAFGEDHNGKVLNKKVTYTYHQFDIEDEEADKKKKERENMLALWLKYLREDMKGLDDADSKKRREYLQRVLIKETESFVADPEKERSIFFGKIASGPTGYKAMVKDGNPAIEINTAGPNSSKNRVLNSTALWGTVGSFAVGFGTSWLLNQASRHAICAGAGLLNLTVPSFVVTAGVALVTTTGKELYDNRSQIADDWKKAKGWTNIKGKFLAVANNIDGSKIQRNTLVGGLVGLGGGLVAGAVLDFFTEDSCLFGNDPISAQQLTNGDDILTTDQPATSPQATPPQMDDVGGPVTYDDLRETFDIDSSSPDDVPSRPPVNADQNGFCPPYLNDCSGSESQIIRDAEYGNVLEDTPAETTAPIAAPAEPAGLAPENEKVIVKSGDNLTNIVEEQYNVDELSNTDSDNDGIRDFDEIMAAVSKANGLEGNQQNWLKVNWELAMPEVEVANAADNINRPALDANWREGDVTFSDVPKLALAA